MCGGGKGQDFFLCGISVNENEMFFLTWDELPSVGLHNWARLQNQHL
jgi:hypothetical protein